MERNCTSLGDNACEDFFVKCYSRSSSKKFRLDPNPQTLVSKLDYDSRRLKIITECMEKFGPKRKLEDVDDTCKRMKIDHEFSERSLDEYSNSFKSEALQKLGNKANNLISVNGQSRIENPRKSMHLTMKKFSEKLQDMKNSGCFSLKKNKEKTVQSKAKAMMLLDDSSSCIACSSNDCKNTVDEQNSFPNICIPHQTCISTSKEFTGHLTTLPSEIHTLQFNNTNYDPNSNIFEICKNFHSEKSNKTSSKLTNMSNDDVLANKVIVFNKKLSEIFAKNTKPCSKNVGSVESSSAVAEIFLAVAERSPTVAESSTSSITREHGGMENNAIQSPVGTSQVTIAICDDSKSSFSASLNSSLPPIPSPPAKTPPSSPVASSSRRETLLPSDAPLSDSVSPEVTACGFIQSASLQLEKDVCFNFEKFRNFLSFKNHGCTLDPKKDDKSIGGLGNEMTARLDNISSNKDSLLYNCNILDRMPSVESQSSEISKKNSCKDDSDVRPLKNCWNEYKKSYDLKCPSNLKSNKKVLKSVNKLQARCLKMIRKKYSRMSKLKHSNVIPKVFLRNETHDDSSIEEIDRSIFSVHQNVPFLVLVDVDPDTSKVGDPKQIQMNTDIQHHQDLTTCHSFDCKESGGCPSCHADDDTFNLNNEFGGMKDRFYEYEDANLKECHVEIPTVTCTTECIQDRLQTSSLCLSGNNDIGDDAENSVISILNFCKEANHDFDSLHHSTKSPQIAVSTESWVENQKNNVDFEAHQSQSSDSDDNFLDCNWVPHVEELEKSEDSMKTDCKNKMPSNSDVEFNYQSGIGHDNLIEKNNNDVNEHNEISSMPPNLQKDDLTHDVLNSPHFAQLSDKDDFLHTYPLCVKNLCDDIHNDNDKLKHDDDDGSLLPQSDILMKSSDQEHIGYVSSDDCKFNNPDFNNNSPFEFDLTDQRILSSTDGKVSLDTIHSDASQMTVDSGITSKVSSLSTGDCTSSPVVRFNFDEEFSTTIILKEKSTKLTDSEFSGSKENHFCESFETTDDDSFSEGVNKDTRLSNSNLLSSISHDSSKTLCLEKLRHNQQVEGSIIPEANCCGTDDDEKQTKLDQQGFADDFIHDNNFKSNKSVEQYGEMIHNGNKSDRNVNDDWGSNDVADEEIQTSNCNKADDVHKAIDNTRMLNKSFNRIDTMDRCSNQGDEVDKYAPNCHYHCMQCGSNGELDGMSFVKSMRSVSPSDGYDDDDDVDGGGGDDDDDDYDKDSHSKSPAFKSHFEEHDGISLFGSYIDSEDETHLTNEEKLWDNITDNSDDEKTSVVISGEENIIKENEGSNVDGIQYGYCHSKHHTTIDRMEKRDEDSDLDSFQDDICSIDRLTNHSQNNDSEIVNNEIENCLDDKSDGNPSDCDITGDYNDDSLNDNLYVENSGASKGINLLTSDDHWLSDISITDSDDDTSNSEESSYVDNEYHSKDIQSGKESVVGDINDFNEQDNFDREVSCSSNVAENSISDIDVKSCKINNKLNKHPSNNLSPYSNVESEHNALSPRSDDDECAEGSVRSIINHDVDSCDGLAAGIIKEVSDPIPEDLISADDDCSSRTDDEMDSKQLFGDGISSSDESCSSIDECCADVRNVGFHFERDVDEEQCYRSLTTECDINANNNDVNNIENNLIKEAKGSSKFERGINNAQDFFDRNETFVDSKNASDADDGSVDDNFESPHYYCCDDEIDEDEMTGNKDHMKLNGKENGLHKRCDSPSRNTDADDVSENSSYEVDEEECNGYVKDNGCYDDEGILFDNYHNSRLSDHEEEDGILSNNFNFSGDDNGESSRNEFETNSSDDHCHFVDKHPSHSESSRVDQSVSGNSPISYQNFPNDCPGKLEPFDPAMNADSFSTNENFETLQTEMLCNLAIKSDLDFDNDQIDRHYDEIGSSHDKLYCAATSVGQCIDSDQKMSFSDPLSTNVQSMMAEYAEIYNRMGYSNSSVNLCGRFRNSQLCVTDLFADFDDPYAGYPENQVNNIYKQYSLASTYRDLYVAYNYTNGYDFYRHYNDIIKMHCRSYNYEPTSDEENNGLDLRIKTIQSRDAGSNEQELLRKENDVPGNNNISEVLPKGLNLDIGKFVVGSASSSDFKNKVFVEKQGDDDDDIDVKYCTWEEINRASYNENGSAFCSSDLGIAFNDSDFREKAMVYKELNDDCNRTDSGGDDDDETVRIDDFVDFGIETNIKEKNEAFANVDGNSAEETEGDMLRMEVRNGRELIQAYKTSKEKPHDFDEGECDYGENYIINNINDPEGAVTTGNTSDKGDSISTDQYSCMKTDEKNSHSSQNSTSSEEFQKCDDVDNSIHDTCDDIPKKVTCGTDSQNWEKSFDEALSLSCAESNFSIDSENVNDGDKNADDQMAKNPIDHAILKTLTPPCNSNCEQEENCYYSSGGQNFNEVVNYLHEIIPSPLNLTLKEFSSVTKSHEFEKICNLESKKIEAKERSILQQPLNSRDYKEISQSINMNAVHLNSDINYNTLDSFVSEEMTAVRCSEEMDGNIAMKNVLSPALGERFSNENIIDDDSDAQQNIMYDEVGSYSVHKDDACSKDSKQRIWVKDRVMDPDKDDITELNKSNTIVQGNESSHNQGNEINHNQGNEINHKLDEKHDHRGNNLDFSVNHNFNSIFLSANTCVSNHGDETSENLKTIGYGNGMNTNGWDINFGRTDCMDIEQTLKDSNIKDHDNSSTNDLYFVTLSEGKEKNATSENLTNFVDDNGDERNFLGNESVNIQRDFGNEGPHAIMSCKEPREGKYSSEHTEFSNLSNCSNKTPLDDASLLHDGVSAVESLCNQANTKNTGECDICSLNDNPSQRSVEKGNGDLDAHNVNPPQVLNRNDEQYEDYVISTEEYDDFACNNQTHHNNDNKGKGLDNRDITEDYIKESLENISRIEEKESKDIESKVRTAYNGNNNNLQNILDKRNLESFSNYNKTSYGTLVTSSDECDFDYMGEDSNNVDFCGSPHLNPLSRAKTVSYSGDESSSQMIEKSQITFGITSNLMEDSSKVHTKNMDFCAESASVCFAASHYTSTSSNCEENHSTFDNCEANSLEKTCKFGDCYESEESFDKCTRNKQVVDLDTSDLKSSESSNGLELISDKFREKGSNDELCNLDVHSIDSYIPVQSPHEKVINFEVNAEAAFDNILESEDSSVHKKYEGVEKFKEVEPNDGCLTSCSSESKEDSSNNTVGIGNLPETADHVEDTVEDDVSSPNSNLIENNHDERNGDNNKLNDDVDPDVRDEMTADDMRNKHDLQKSARNVFDDVMISLTSVPLKSEEFPLETVISNVSKQDDPMVNTSGEKLEDMSQMRPVCPAKMTNSNSLSQNVINAKCISEKSIATSTHKKDLIESNIKYQEGMSEKSLTNLLDGFDFSRRNYQAQSGISPQSSSNNFFQGQSDMAGMLQEEPVDDDPEELQAAVESILNIDFFSSKYADDEDLHQIENNVFVDRYDCNYFSDADRSPVLLPAEKRDAIDFMSSDILSGEEDDEDEASRDGKELAMKFYSTCQQKDPDNSTYNIHTFTPSTISQSGLEGSNIGAESSASAAELSNSLDEIPSECLSQGNKANFFKSFKSKWLSMNNNSEHFDKQALSLISEKTSKAMYCRTVTEKQKKKRKILKRQRKAQHWKYLRLTYIIQKFQKLKFQAQRRKQIIQLWGKKSVKNTEVENYLIACFKSKLYIGYEPNDDFSLNDFKNKNIFYLGSPCGMSSCSFFRESERREHLNSSDASGHEKYLLRKPVFLYESGCLGNQISFVKSKLLPVNQKQNSFHDKASAAMQHHPSSSCSYKDTTSQGNSQNLPCNIPADVKIPFDASYGFKDDSCAMMTSERQRAYHCPNDVVDNMPKQTFQTKCKGDLLEMKCPSMPYYDEQSSISINSSSTHILRAKPEPHYNIHLDHLPSYAELNNVCTLQRVKAANRPIRPTPLYKESFSGFPAMGQGFPNYRLTHLSAHNIGEACCLPASDNIYKGQPGILPDNSASNFVSQMKNGLQTHLASRLNLPPVHGYVSNLTNPRMVMNQNDCHMFGANCMDHSRHSIHPESYHLQRHYIPYADFQAPYRYSVSYSSYPSSGSHKIGAQGNTVPQTEETERCHTVIDNNGHRATLRSQIIDNDSFKHSNVHSFNSKDVFDLREVYLPRNSSDMGSYSMFKLKAKKSELSTPLDHNFSRSKMDKKKDVGLHPSNLRDLHDVAPKGDSNRLGNRASHKANYQIETLLMNPGNVRTRNYKQITPSSNAPISHPYYQPNMNAGFTEIPIYKFYPDTFCNYSASVSDHPNTNHYNPSRNYRGNVNLSNVYRYSLSSDKFNGNLH